MNSFYSIIANTQLYKKLAKSPVPRWSVLVLDTLCVIVSCFILVFADLYRFGNNVINPIFFTVSKYAAVVLVYLLINLYTKSYQCIIRLSVLVDLYRVFLTVLYSTIILIFLTYFASQISTQYIFRFWDIPLIGCICFTLFSMMRLSIKYVFMKLGTPGIERKNVIILGSALNSIVIASAISNESGGKFNPVALLSVTGKKHSYKANGFPIETYDKDRIKEIFERRNADTLIFLSTHNELMRSGFADEFLKNGITLLHLNQVEEFDINEADADSTPKISTHIRNVQIEDLLGRDQIEPDKSLAKSEIQGQCVMITGAAGSIGSEIVRQVATFGASKIILVDQAETPMHNMQLEMEEKFPNINIELFIGDVKNYKRMEQAFSEFHPRFVFHAAAYKHVPMMEVNPSEAILTNVMGTKNVADLALKYNAHKFVMVSTDKAVNPTNIMGATKRIAEIYVQSLFFHNKAKDDDPNTTQYITTRFGNVLGSNGSVIPRFRQQIENGGPVTVTHKEIIRYFMTIKEACSLVLEAGCIGNGGEIYIFDMGQPIRIYDLAARMITLAGLKVGKDIEIVETGLRPGEKLYEELLNDKEKTRATVNQKIMIAKVQKYDYTDVCQHYDKIISAAESGNIHQLVLEMKQFVPEYKSNNSLFVEIDKEIEDEKSVAGNNDATSAVK